MTADERTALGREGIAALLPEVRRVWTEEDGRSHADVDADFARLWSLVDRIAPPDPGNTKNAADYSKVMHARGIAHDRQIGAILQVVNDPATLPRVMS